MTFPNYNTPEDEMKKWLHYIAFICLSEEFQKLKNELEEIYQNSGVKDYKITAFQDALYAFLAEEERNSIQESGAY